MELSSEVLDFHAAVEAGDVESMEILLQLFDSNDLLLSENADQWTALEIACYKGHFEVVQLILQQRMDILRRSLSREEAKISISLAYGKKHYRIVYLLIHSIDPSLLPRARNMRADPLLFALSRRWKDLVILLEDITTKLELNKAFKQMSLELRQKCFSWALDENLISLAERIADFDRKSCIYLPYHDTKIVQSVSLPANPPSFIVSFKKFFSVKTVKKPKMSINPRKTNETSTRNKQPKARGSEVPTQSNSASCTPSDIDTDESNVEIENNKVSFETRDVTMATGAFHKLILSKNVAGLKVLLKYGQIDYHAANYQDSSEQTVLHLAVQERFTKGIKLLIKHIAAIIDFDAIDINDDTALHLAIKDEYIEGVRGLVGSAKSKERINFNLRDKDGHTPLHLAVMTGNMSLVETLLTASGTNMDVSADNQDGAMPIQLADREEIINLIVQDQRFLPTKNLMLLDKTILSHLCTLNPTNSCHDLVAKADALFSDITIDPLKSQNELLEANIAENYYIVWCLLKIGPSPVDLRRINFFLALKMGKKHDKEVCRREEMFLHVFSRAGNDRAIRYLMENYDPNNSLHKSLFPGLPAFFQNIKLYQDIEGNNPIMVAAQYNNLACLAALLQPLIAYALEGTDEGKRIIFNVIHHKNKRNEILLSIISRHRLNLSLPYFHIIYLEHISHDANNLAIKACFRENLGSNKQSEQALKLNPVASSSTGCFSKVKTLLTIMLSTLLIATFFIGDITTDARLVIAYYKNFLNESLTGRRVVDFQECSFNITLNCFVTVPSEEAKFYISLLIMVVPFAFYLAEVLYNASPSLSVHKLRQNDQVRLSYKCNYNSIRRFVLLTLTYSLMWLTWPLRAFLLHMYYSIRMEMSSNARYQNFKMQSEKFQVLSARAHCIEVCSESSLQPLLQLYLFLPSFINLCSGISRFPELKLASFASTEGIQFLSVTASVLSVSFSFTSYYVKKKISDTSVFSTGSLIYFVSTMCLVMSRLLAFQAFAYFFGPGNFSWPALFVICHILLMALLHAFFTYYKDGGNTLEEEALGKLTLTPSTTAY